MWYIRFLKRESTCTCSFRKKQTHQSVQTWEPRTHRRPTGGPTACSSYVWVSADVIDHLDDLLAMSSATAIHISARVCIDVYQSHLYSLLIMYPNRAYTLAPPIKKILRTPVTAVAKNPAIRHTTTLRRLCENDKSR